MSRLLRLTLLAPDLVEAILDGRQPRGLTAQELLRGVPVGWREQRKTARWPVTSERTKNANPLLYARDERQKGDEVA